MKLKVTLIPFKTKEDGAMPTVKKEIILESYVLWKYHQAPASNGTVESAINKGLAIEADTNTKRTNAKAGVTEEMLALQAVEDDDGMEINESRV